MPSDERRQFKRSEFRVFAQVSVAGERQTVQLVDFSLKGAQVEHDGQWRAEVGQKCHLHIELGQAAAIEMDATVVRVDGTSVGLEGVNAAELRSLI